MIGTGVGGAIGYFGGDAIGSAISAGVDYVSSSFSSNSSTSSASSGS